MNKQLIDKVAQVLVVIGAINWGLFGIRGWDLVDMSAGSIPVLAKVVYILVGVSGLYVLYNMFKK